MNKKQKSLTNKGFSLVELIIVIAIMAVLVGVLAPQYLKYVNNSKVSTDVASADSIRTAINTLIADSKLTGTSVTLTDGTAAVSTLPASPTDSDYIMNSIGTKLTTKYKSGASFVVTYSTEAGVTKIEYSVPGASGAAATTYEIYPTDNFSATCKK